jgi:hypothetical protein
METLRAEKRAARKAATWAALSAMRSVDLYLGWWVLV